jgi:hypothetical protein
MPGEAAPPQEIRMRPQIAALALWAAAAPMSFAEGFGAAGPDFAPPVRIDVLGGTDAANETAAAASPARPGVIVAAWNDWRESSGVEIIRMGVGLSLDGGATWQDFLVRPPAPFQSGVEGDPMATADPRTGAIWVGAISFAGNGGMYVARLDPGSSQFQPSVMADPGGGLDKCWMAAGPRPGIPDSTRVYCTYNLGVIWSDTMGDTWTQPQSLGSGLGFLPRVGPLGELYIIYWHVGANEFRLQRSLGGGPFTTHVVAQRMDNFGVEVNNTRFPGTFRAPPLAYLAVDPNDGTLYAVYFDTTGMAFGLFDVDIYFTRSEDQGSTWTTPTIVNGDTLPPSDSFFPWIEVDPEGRLHLVYFDSRHTPQAENVVNGMFDAYYAYSEDRGATWHEHRLTPQSWNSNNDGLDRPFQFIGDYLCLAHDGDAAYPIYLDTSAGDPDVFTRRVVFPSAVQGDTNGDGVVNVVDLVTVVTLWGECPAEPEPCPADVDGNGAVDVGDMVIVILNWS